LGILTEEIHSDDPAGLPSAGNKTLYCYRAVAGCSTPDTWYSRPPRRLRLTSQIL